MNCRSDNIPWCTLHSLFWGHFTSYPRKCSNPSISGRYRGIFWHLSSLCPSAHFAKSGRNIKICTVCTYLCFSNQRMYCRRLGKLNLQTSNSRLGIICIYRRRSFVCSYNLMLYRRRCAQTEWTCPGTELSGSHRSSLSPIALLNLCSIW